MNKRRLSMDWVSRIREDREFWKEQTETANLMGAKVDLEMSINRDTLASRDKLENREHWI